MRVAIHTVSFSARTITWRVSHRQRYSIYYRGRVLDRHQPSGVQVERALPDPWEMVISPHGPSFWYAYLHNDLPY